MEKRDRAISMEFAERKTFEKSTLGWQTFGQVYKIKKVKVVHW